MTRKCVRCAGEMLENCDIKVEGAAYGIIVASDTRIFADRLGKPNVAICKTCGEISLSVKDVNALERNGD